MQGIVSKLKAQPEPTTLDAALETIGQFRDLVDGLLEQVESISADSDRFEERAREAEASAEAADALYSEQIMELARILQKMKCGRASEAVGDLDRFLQEADCGGKYRCAAVAVMM